MANFVLSRNGRDYINLDLVARLEPTKDGGFYCRNAADVVIGAVHHRTVEVALGSNRYAQAAE